MVERTIFHHQDNNMFEFVQSWRHISLFPITGKSQLTRQFKLIAFKRTSFCKIALGPHIDSDRYLKIVSQKIPFRDSTAALFWQPLIENVMA